ncbi:MAG: TonB-dependent receptor domain-containing protein [Rhodanobacteraceae bacterium]
MAIGSITLGFAGAGWAQATTGTIRGKVPIAANETIQVTGGAGFSRTITVGPSGKYSITLPVGTYTVSLLQNGRVVQNKTGVSPAAAGAVEVDFASSVSASNAPTLSAINVTASAIPAIDVTTTNQVTTITAKQLQQLPLQRTAENIALLAPGVNLGAPSLGTGPLGTPVLAFGGASVAENAYYLDGMDTTNELDAMGGISLPYGAIEQQQTFISGYGAQYGRSIGGVINQIGMSGSNQWHFGVRALWQPASLQSDFVNGYWNNPRSTTGGEEPGDINQYRQGDHSLENIYDAYVSGPIIKDKLFFFVAAEQDNTLSNTIGSISNPYNTFSTTHQPKIYAKLNWNINSSNFLTLTAVQNSLKQWQSNYNFDYGNSQSGAFTGTNPAIKNTFRVWVANFTSDITDNLTLHAMLGKMHGEYYTGQPTFSGFSSDLPNIVSASQQNPAFVPPGGISNPQVNQTTPVPSHSDSIMNYRVSLNYTWGNHDFQVGIDNLQTWDKNDGNLTTGPGFAWIYGQGDPGTPIVGENPDSPPYAGPPDSNPAGAGGYYVSQAFNQIVATLRVSQYAQYVQDNWQITPNLLLNLGLRNDQFTNFNSAGVPYINLTKPQWAPRIGFSWNVRGDSTLKVFGNAGRYYLALPAEVALLEAGNPLITNLYGTYTGINQTTGEPIGFKPVPQNPQTGVSANNEYGQPQNPLAAASRNVGAEYSDNFVLGLQQQFQMMGAKYVFGATGTYQEMPRIIDDWDDLQAICTAGRAQGLAYMTTETCDQWNTGGPLINPTETSDILVTSPNGSLRQVVVTPADQGFERGVKRNYYSLDLSLTHVWNGKWFAKLDYVYSRSYGNTEGPVDSATGQNGEFISVTEQWDFASLMEWSDGLQANDRKHQLKLYGAYAINPEWTIGGNLYIASGTPDVCLGAYGPDQTDPVGYGDGAYHYCGGIPAPPGSTGFTPWIHNIDLNVDYKPAWAAHKLDFNVAVFNVFNKQTPTQFNPTYGTTDTPDPTYQLVEGFQPPRMVRFSLAYDF